MKRSTAALLTGALATGSALVLSVAVPGVASANGCGTTTLNEAGTGTTAWNAPGRFSTALGDQRSAGHSEVVDGGLHVYTDNNTSLAKAAALYPVANLALADYTAESNYGLTLTSTTGTPPGYNLAVDMNGSAAGGFTTLVLEPAYQGRWHTSQTPDKSTAGIVLPNPGVDGYAGAGSIQEFSDANPDAVIQAFGYSLGSGVKGDTVITKIRFGCNDFVFDLANRAPVANLRIDNGGDSDYRTYWLSGVQSTDPDGDDLTYTFKVDGVPIPNPENKPEFKYTFPKGKKSYQVTLTVSDGPLNSTSAAQQVDVQPALNTVGGPLANTGADVKGLAALGGLVVAGSAAGLVANRRRKGAGAA
jgi:hypothetical protein